MNKFKESGKFFATIQQVGKSFFLPVSVLPIAGLLLGLGSSFTNQTTMTVSVRVRGNAILVRANASAGTKAITEPQAYQNFFNALSQSLFLTANEVL